MMKIEAAHTNGNNPFPTWMYESRITQHSWATTNVAVVYSYMLARYRFHAKNNRKYFESYQYIASATNVSLRTVKTAVKLLLKHGHLTYTQKKAAIGKNNVYELKNIYSTWAPGFDEFPDGRPVSAKDKPANHSKESVKRIPNSRLEDEICEEPF
jgi:hypothetical protein